MNYADLLDPRFDWHDIELQVAGALAELGTKPDDGERKDKARRFRELWGSPTGRITKT